MSVASTLHRVALSLLLAAMSHELPLTHCIGHVHMVRRMCQPSACAKHIYAVSPLYTRMMGMSCNAALQVQEHARTYLPGQIAPLSS